MEERNSRNWVHNNRTYKNIEKQFMELRDKVNDQEAIDKIGDILELIIQLKFNLKLEEVERFVEKDNYSSWKIRESIINLKNMFFLIQKRQ